MAAEVLNPIKIFYCYAHEDRALRDELEKHLGALKRSGRITTWYDREIAPGDEWENKIHERLNTADMVLLLVSPDFIDSDYCWGIEMQRALARRQSEQIAVLPIILRPVFWKGTPIATLQLLPSEGKAITAWSDRDAAFEDVANGIYEVVEALHMQRARKAEEERQAREEQARREAEMNARRLEEDMARRAAWAERVARAESGRRRAKREQQDATNLVTGRGQRLLPVRLEAASKTDVGRSLEKNTDCVRMQLSTDANAGIFAVADGLGGGAFFVGQYLSYRFGEVASRIAVDKASEALNPLLLMEPEKPSIALSPLSEQETILLQKPDARQSSATPIITDAEKLLRNAFSQINAAILRYSDAHPEAHGLACTLTVALILDRDLYIGHIGNSRVYLLRDRSLFPLTRDHTLAARLAESQQIAPYDIYTHSQRYALYKALGVGQGNEPDLYHEQLHSGDTLLLCSDGLWQMVRTPDLQGLLAARGAPQQLCDTLIEQANVCGGEDNISALVVRIS